MKDNFSKISQRYAQFRPVYPKEVFEFIASLGCSHETAWDCATGNGQVARGLVPYFREIMATDISEQQIKHAHPGNNIHYSVSSAEHTSFPKNYFDLITIGQAIHWFNFSSFYAEVNRTAKKGAHVVVLGYDLIKVDQTTDKIVHHFYHEVLKDCWDAERKYVDERYQTIPFPFKEISPPEFQLTLDWTIEKMLGYLGTWSAVQHFKDRFHRNPIDEIREPLEKTWKPDQDKTVNFPIMMRVGIIEKK